MRPDTVVVPARVTPEDSLVLAAQDTVVREPADTVKPPLPRSAAPADLRFGPGYRWDRDALFAAGAMNMLELLERVPGITGFRTGWLASPHLGAYAGNVGAVRFFLDGIELASLSPREMPAVDLAEVPLWNLDEVVVEPGAGEVRVYMRTWTVDRTTPFTRTDVYTGNENTNVYRGYFGRRFGRGEALQIAGEQYGTRSNLAGTGDQLALLGRIGIGRTGWGADAFVIRSSRTRSSQTPLLGGDPLSPLDARSTVAYVRASAGNYTAGPWAQVVGASQAFDDRRPREEDEPDSSASVSDWIATGGYSWSRARLSAAARIRAGPERTRLSQSIRASAGVGPIAAQLFAEHGAVDSVTRVEGSARVNLLGPLVAMGTAGWVDDRREIDGDAALFGRGELGVTLGRLWLSGGVIYRDSTVLPAPRLLEQPLIDVHEPAAVGAVFAANGRVWRDVGIDGHFVGWRTDGWYRPQFHGIGRLFLDTRWLSRFPSGNLGILLVGQAEYRSAVPFPRAEGVDLAAESLVFSTMIEIRIVDAVLTFQLRNPRPSRYVQVPGFLMPGQMQYYGVRWAFWN